MKDTCLVKNRGASHVSYRIPEDGIRRSFAPGETKEISYKELEKVCVLSLKNEVIEEEVYYYYITSLEGEKYSVSITHQ